MKESTSILLMEGDRAEAGGDKKKKDGDQFGGRGSR